MLHESLTKIFGNILSISLFILYWLWVPRLGDLFLKNQLFLSRWSSFPLGSFMPVIWLSVQRTIAWCSWRRANPVGKKGILTSRFELRKEFISVLNKEVNFLKSDFCDFDKFGVLFWADIVLNFNLGVLTTWPIFPTCFSIAIGTVSWVEVEHFFWFNNPWDHVFLHFHYVFSL